MCNSWSDIASVLARGKHQQRLARIQAPALESPLRAIVDAVGQVPSGKIDRCLTRVIDLQPVRIAAVFVFDRLIIRGHHLGDQQIARPTRSAAPGVLVGAMGRRSLRRRRRQNPPPDEAFPGTPWTKLPTSTEDHRSIPPQKRHGLDMTRSSIRPDELVQCGQKGHLHRPLDSTRFHHRAHGRRIFWTYGRLDLL